MRLVFLGSGEFGLAALRALFDAGFDVVLVVTQPPRRRRRRSAPEPTPVHAEALERGIPVATPDKVRSDEALDALRVAKADLFVVAEYGQILSQALLDIPPLGAINVHSSLLPRHRGATPIVAAIAAGDTETGVTIQRVVRALDAGDVLARRSLPIEPTETAGELTARMAPIGGELLVEVVTAFAAGTPPEGEPQDESAVTVCKRLTSENGVIDWARSVAEVDRHVRAMTPKPGARTSWRDLGLVIRRGQPLDGAEASPGPGVIASGFDVGCADGLYRVLEVVPAGRKPMGARDFLNGNPIQAGDHLA